MRDIDSEVVAMKEITLLGVTSNSKLTWNAHCNFILKDCGKWLNGISLLRGTFSENDLLRMYQDWCFQR